MRAGISFHGRSVVGNIAFFCGILMRSVGQIFGLFLVVVFFTKKGESIKLIKMFYSENVGRILERNIDICANVEIGEVNNLDYKRLRSSVDAFCNEKNYDLETLKNSLLEDAWIKDVHLKKVIPNRLKIDIVEYQPFAMFSNGKKRSLIDQFGSRIGVEDEELSKFEHLLLVSGDGFEEEINSFFNLLSIHSNIAKNLYKIERIGKRRWNLVLKNNILIKLPEEDEGIFETWDILEKILNVYGLSVDLESVDLRVKKRIYLQYNMSQFPKILEL